MVLLLMLKRALSIPSKRSRSRRVCEESKEHFLHLKCGRKVFEGKKYLIRFGRISEKAISRVVKKKAFSSSSSSSSFGKEKKTKKTKAREKSTFDHRSREREN